MKLVELARTAQGPELDQLKQLILRTQNLEGTGREGKSFSSLAFEYLGLMTQLDQADAMPTAQQISGLAELGKREIDLDAAWVELRLQGLKRLTP